ncbi:MULTISPECIES: hypothetical protein [unclassified Acidovorax]|uniref:hypothetical protein n=1 Tax=unclassified Acidovorax TaxID=2684926 RepID=UPI000B200B21|nr:MULTISPECIES: hypothetical protein [unclassified Acidovorax]
MKSAVFLSISMTFTVFAQAGRCVLTSVFSGGEIYPDGGSVMVEVEDGYRKKSIIKFDASLGRGHPILTIDGKK